MPRNKVVIKLFVFPLLVFFGLSLLITSTWFNSGLMYGGAEVGILGYPSERYQELPSYIWWSGVAPGMLVPQFVSAVPFYSLLLFLKGFSPVLIQSMIYLTLLFTMGYGIYLFSLSVLGREKYKFAYIAAFFYMFNSYMMVEVWHRFLFTGFFLAACLPLVALFWKYWMDEGKAVYLAIFLLIDLAFSYMFGNLTSAMAIWLVLGMMWVAKIVLPWQGKKNFFQITSRFLIGFVLFILTNLWWMMPVALVSTSVLPEQHSFEDNISTLINISKQTALPFTLQFANPFYLFYSQELGAMYSNFFFQLLPWFPASVIFLGLIYGLRLKNIAAFSLFYLIAIVIAKGAAPPFGHAYIWGFMNVFILGVIRNPFEKLGILLPFFGSILFAVGIDAILILPTKKLGMIIPRLLVGVVLISIVIYALPMFSTMVFNKPGYPLQVKVPPSYEEANTWLKEQHGQGNILQLPFPSHDVVTYNWKNGYHGVEINEILFTALPSITRNVGVDRIDGTLKSLTFIFNQPFADDKKRILNILQSLNVKYILLHKDTRWEDTTTYGKDIRLSNPTEIEQTLDNLEFLEKSHTFGDLVIYSLRPQFSSSKISLINNPDLVYPGESNLLQDYDLFTADNQLTPVSKKINPKVLSNVSQTLLFPDKTIISWEPSIQTLSNLLDKNIQDSSDVSTPFGQLAESKKAFFTDTGELLSETLITNLITADNDLISLLQSKKSRNNSSEEILNDYQNRIDSFFNKGFNGSSLQQIIKPLLVKVFTMHLFILDNFSDKASQNAKRILNNYLVKNNILPNSRLDRNSIKQDIQRRVQKFTIPVDGKFELLLTDTDNLVLYPDALSKLNFQLDGRRIVISITKQGNVISFGKIELAKGPHEISYEILPSINLVDDLNKFSFQGLSQKNDATSLKFGDNQQSGGAGRVEIPNVFGGDSYELTFEAMIDNPRQFYFQTVEDTESPDSPFDCSKVVCSVINPVTNSNPNSWNNYSLNLGPLNHASRKAFLQILLPVVTTGSSSTTTLTLKNLNLNRIMDNNMVLRISASNQATASAGMIIQRQISPVLYQGKLTIDHPSFMFFKESYNPQWILTLTKDNQSINVNDHLLGNLYGNMYFIDKPGDYSFKLEFTPQQTVNKGIIASIFGWIIILGFLIYSEIIKRKSNE